MAYFFHAGRCKNLEPRKKFTFPKKNRIKSKAGFQLVYTTGRSVVDSLSVLYVLPLDAEGPKIGFAVGKKIGNAVVARKKLAAADLKTYDRVFMRLAKRAVLLK